MTDLQKSEHQGLQRTRASRTLLISQQRRKSTNLFRSAMSEKCHVAARPDDALIPLMPSSVSQIQPNEIIDQLVVKGTPPSVNGNHARDYRSRPGGTRYLLDVLIGCGVHSPERHVSIPRKFHHHRIPLCSGLSGVVVLSSSSDESEDAMNTRIEEIPDCYSHKAWVTPSCQQSYRCATAICQFLGSIDSNFELPLKRGEQLWVLADSVLLDDNWILGKSVLTGLVGLCPKACIEVQPETNLTAYYPSKGDEAVSVAAEMLNDERISWVEFVHLLSLTPKRRPEILKSGNVHHL